MTADPVIVRLSAEQLWIFTRPLQAAGFKPARQIELRQKGEAVALYRAALGLWGGPKRKLSPWQAVARDRLARKLEQAGRKLGRKG